MRDLEPSRTKGHRGGDMRGGAAAHSSGGRAAVATYYRRRKVVHSVGRGGEGVNQEGACKAR